MSISVVIKHLITKDITMWIDQWLTSHNYSLNKNTNGDISRIFFGISDCRIKQQVSEAAVTAPVGSGPSQFI